MAEVRRYYWLKLKRDFFKRHDIRVVESMPNGKDYVLFYLKLMLEAIDHEGNLRFSDTIPYNVDMLAAVTNTNVDVVKSAMNIFTQLQMIEILDDQTIFMNEVEKLVGSETNYAKKMRDSRERKKIAQGNNVTPMLPERYPEKEIEIEKELDKENIIRGDSAESPKPTTKRFKPPTIEEVKEYCKERSNGVDAERFVDFYEAKGWMLGKNKMKDWKAAVRTWERKNADGQVSGDNAENQQYGNFV